VEARAWDSLVYQKSGLGIIITFFNGKADAIFYRKIATNVLGKGEKISENEMEILLKSIPAAFLGRSVP
jgi:hypothetical protein